MKWLFREKLKIGKDISKTDLPHISCKEKCKKWDRIIASWFGLFAFFSLVGFVIYNILHTNTSRCGTSSKTDLQLYGDEEDNKCIVDANCIVRCSNIVEEEKSVAEYINKSLENKSCNSKITLLKITSTTFKQSKLSFGWLSNIKPKVNDLEIENCILDEITINSFAGHPFKLLRRLRIVNANIPVLKRESFLGLESLGDFSFCNYGSAIYLKIEKGALEGMSRTLEILELSKYKFSAEDIINLTGNKAPDLPKLVTVVLSYNSILELKERSFSKAPQLTQLFLHDSALTNIHEQAFRNLYALRRLDLSKNLLKTLPAGSFSSFTTYSGGIELWENNWQCDCFLQWLKDYYMQNEFINKTKPPLCYEEQLTFDKVEFCTDFPTATPPSTESTPSSSSTRTTPEPELPPNYIKVKCQDRKLAPSDAKVDVTHSVEVVVNNKNLQLLFHELEGSPPRVVMRTTEDLTDYHLLWFNADYRTETGCRSPVEDQMLLEDFKYNTTYSFSLLYAEETQVSPNCTFCIKTEPEWKFRSWINNKYRVAVIVLAACIGIFLVCLTGFLTFLCIRHHPKMISGNKNVIIVKPKKNAVEDVPPREYERPAYWEPSSHGYLTPNCQRYAKVRYRPPLMRSISEWSITSSSRQCNYDDPRELRAFKLLRPLRQSPNELIDVDVYDYRPPLPPPNPGSKGPSAPPQEELYSSV